MNNGQNVKLSIKSMIKQPRKNADNIDDLDDMAIMGEMDPEEKTKFTEYWKGIGHGKLQGNLEGLERQLQQSKAQFINLFKQ